jgi:mercuric ion transport protein
MTDPAADPRPHRAPKALGGLAALACVACCALPVLITAGVVGAGAGAVVGWLPAVAVVLAVLAAGTWWLGQRRGSCSCAPNTRTAGGGGCGCKTSGEALKVTGADRRA